MNKFLQKERTQWIVMLTLLIASVVILIFFFEWLSLPYSTLWRFMLYSTLIILCIPMFVETLLHKKVKTEHEKLIAELKIIEQDLKDYRSRMIAQAETTLASAQPLVPEPAEPISQAPVLNARKARPRMIKRIKAKPARRKKPVKKRPARRRRK